MENAGALMRWQVLIKRIRTGAMASDMLDWRLELHVSCTAFSNAFGRFPARKGFPMCCSWRGLPPRNAPA